MISEVLITLVLATAQISAPDLKEAPLQLADYILPAQRIVLYPPEGDLRMLSALAMPPAAKEAFDTEFASSTYFSAFALSKSGGWGYATTTNSIGAARSIAMQECLSQNTECIIIAEIVPRGFRELQPGDITLTPLVADLYRNPSSAGEVSGFRAMAISADGAYSMVWGHASQAAADAAAMSD